MEEYQHASDLRARVVQEMRGDPEAYNLGLAIEEDDNYLESMAKSGTWADERVHLAMARVLKQDVLCISWNPIQQKYYYMVTNEFPESKIIPVLYNGVNHYDLLEEVALLGQGIVPDGRLRQVRKQLHKSSVRWTRGRSYEAVEGKQSHAKGKKRKAEEAAAEEGELDRPWRERIQGHMPTGALKHKKVLDDCSFRDGDLDLYKTWTTKSVVDGGKHHRILAPSTCQKHLHGYRSLCYFLVQEKLVTEPVTFEDALTKSNLAAYLSHLQHNNTARNMAMNPSTLKAWRTSMGVFAGLALAHGPMREGENRKNRRRQARRLQAQNSPYSVCFVLVYDFILV